MNEHELTIGSEKNENELKGLTESAISDINDIIIPDYYKEIAETARKTAGRLIERNAGLATINSLFEDIERWKKIGEELKRAGQPLAVI